MRGAKYSKCLMLAFLLCGCNVEHRESLNAFAFAYVNFHKAVYDSEIPMWGIGLDVSERPDATGKVTTTFRQKYIAAFDVKRNNRERADNARQAVAAHDSNSMLDSFEMRNDKCDGLSLALVEKANAIKNDEYRNQAVLLAGTARQISSVFAELRTVYSEIYDLQVDLSSELAANNGDMRLILPSIKQKAPELAKQIDAVDPLTAKEQAAVRTMETQYAAFKGATGIAVDYVPPRQ